MAYDESTARRLRAALLRAHPAEPIDERKMFGGLALLAGGNMACGVMGGELLIRVPEAEAAALLGRPHVRPMTFTGRPMRAFVVVAPPGFADEAALDGWVALGLAAARAAANRPKPARARKPAPRRVALAR